MFHQTVNPAKLPEISDKPAKDAAQKTEDAP